MILCRVLWWWWALIHGLLVQVQCRSAYWRCLLSTLYGHWIILKNKWLRWSRSGFKKDILLVWLRFLDCGGLTPSQRRRLDS